MKKIVKYYPEAWFKVEYEVHETYINFKAWRIKSSDEERPQNLVFEDRETCITGSIKWDDCMNFKQNDHYCGMHHAKQVFILMSEIYQFKDTAICDHEWCGEFLMGYTCEKCGKRYNDAYVE